MCEKKNNAEHRLPEVTVQTAAQKKKVLLMRKKAPQSVLFGVDDNKPRQLCVPGTSSSKRLVCSLVVTVT